LQKNQTAVSGFILLTTAMGKEPVNITRLKRLNDQVTDAVIHARDLQIAKSNAKWFSDAFTNADKAELNAQTKEFISKETSLIERYKVGATDQIAQELTNANIAIRTLRKDRLRDLMHKERRFYEAELNAIGLAYDKHRD
jgi:hypothetical protein